MEMLPIVGATRGLAWFSLSSTAVGLVLKGLFEVNVFTGVGGLASAAAAAAMPFGSNAFNVGVSGFAFGEPNDGFPMPVLKVNALGFDAAADDGANGMLGFGVDEATDEVPKVVLADGADVPNGKPDVTGLVGETIAAALENGDGSGVEKVLLGAPPNMDVPEMEKGLDADTVASGVLNPKPAVDCGLGAGNVKVDGFDWPNDGAAAVVGSLLADPKEMGAADVENPNGLST